MNAILLCLAFAAQPISAESGVVEKPLGILIQVRPGTMEAALRKIDYAGIKAIDTKGDFLTCEAKASRVQFAEQLRHEAEIAGVWVDMPCERFVVCWRGADAYQALEELRMEDVKVRYQHKFLPFAVCQGPLTAETRAIFDRSRCIETVEPEAAEEPKK
jgi:hypothetical protein